MVSKLAMLNSEYAAAGVAFSDGFPFMLRPARLEDAADLIQIQRQVVEENVGSVSDHIDTLEECRPRIALHLPQSRSPRMTTPFQGTRC